MRQIKNLKPIIFDHKDFNISSTDKVTVKFSYQIPIEKIKTSDTGPSDNQFDVFELKLKFHAIG